MMPPRIRRYAAILRNAAPPQRALLRLTDKLPTMPNDRPGDATDRRHA